jgi:hypothetical protein
MDLKKKVSAIKTKIKQHPNCVIAIGSMLITGAALGYYSGKELSKAKAGSRMMTDILEEFADGGKREVWLDGGHIYVQYPPASEEDL